MNSSITGDVACYQSLWDPEGYPSRISGLEQNGATCKEPVGAPRYLYSERHIQCIWYDDRLRPSLLETRAGEPVHVIHPGHWNLEAGPDFTRAILLVGPDKRRLEGDIEIHIRPGDWLRHRHSTNPRYRNLIAHISWFPGSLDAAMLPPGCLQLALAPAVDKRPDFSFDRIDIAAYPYAVPPPSCPACAEALQGLPIDQLFRFLDAAGIHRLDQKAERMRVALQRGINRETILYTSIMGALGYKRNTSACHELAHRVPLVALRETDDALTAYALLLGVSGLLPAQSGSHWPADARAELRALWDRWWPLQERWRTRLMSSNDWVLGGIRPLNHPRRRLAVAASLFGAGAPWLDDPALHHLEAAGSNWIPDAVARLSDCNRVPYWSKRQSFSGNASASPVRLLSPRRAAGIIINTVIPYRLATALDTLDTLPELPPEPDNAVIRQSAHLLLGRDHSPSLYSRSGRRQQGLIQLFQEFCLASRSVCRDCPLVSVINAFARATP